MPFHSLPEGIPGPPGPAGPGTFTEETSIVSVRDYGATGNGVTGDRDAIYNAIAAANDRELLFPAGTYRVESDLTFSCRVGIRFLNGSKLCIDSGVTVTIDGPLEAGLYQIFSGDGSVNMGKGAVPMIYPQWWGAVGDDSTDNSSAFNKALGMVGNIGVLYIPTGRYQLSSPIDTFPTDYASYQRSGIIIRGAGMKDTILKYTGSSGYCVELKAEDQLDTKAVNYVTLEDLHIMAPNIASSGGGVLFSAASHCHLERVAFSNINNSYGTAIHARKRNIILSEESYTHDTNRDFTSSGQGSSEKYAIKFTTPMLAAYIKQVTVQLGRTGTPSGTIRAYIYDDNAGKPGSQLGGASDSVSCSSLSTDADGGNVTFTFTLFEDMPPVSGSTDYWLVLETTGYTYTEGVTEVRLRVDAGDGDTDGFATYDAGASTWSTSNDGANNTILVRYGQCIMNKLREVYVYGGTQANLGVKMEEDSQFHISDSNFACVNGIEAEGDPIIYCTRTQFSTTQCPLNIAGGTSSWISTYMEGGGASYPVRFDGGSLHSILSSSLGVYMTWGKGTPLEIRNCFGPLYYTDDATIPHDRYFYKIYDAESRYMIWDGGAILVSDSDALNGKCIQIAEQYCNFHIDWGTTSQRQYTYLPRGTYMVTVYARDTNQLANDMRLYVQHYSPDTPMAERRYTLTNDYKPYRIIFHVGSSQVGKHILFMIQRLASGVNTISVSHIVFEYLGTDILLKHDVVAYNSEMSDADGARETKNLFAGRQSNGEQSVLATITASHYGPDNDEKGKLEFAVNSGNDGYSPTRRLSIDSDGKMDVSGRLCTGTITNFSSGDTTPSVSAGNIFKTANAGPTIISTFDDGGTGQMITVIIGDNNTVIDFTGTNLRGNNGTDWTPKLGDHMTCVFDGANWYCTISDNTL